jgi:hypothetical protein
MGSQEEGVSSYGLLISITNVAFLRKIPETTFQEGRGKKPRYRFHLLTNETKIIETYQLPKKTSDILHHRAPAVCCQVAAMAVGRVGVSGVQKRRNKTLLDMGENLSGYK